MLKPIPTYRLIKNFPSTYKFCKGGLNKIALLLRKDVYPYEYMDNWEKFNKNSLPDKIAFYSKLNKKRHYQYRLCACSKSVGSI